MQASEPVNAKDTPRQVAEQRPLAGQRPLAEQRPPDIPDLAVLDQAAATADKKKSRKRRFAEKAGMLVFAPVSIPAWLVYRSLPKQRSSRRVRKALKHRNQPIKALTLLEEAHDRNPKNNDILFYAGALANQANFHEAAAQYFTHYLERAEQPEPLARLILGDSHYRTGRYKEAIAALQGIPDDFSGKLKVLLLLAAAFEQIGDVEAAVETLEGGPLIERNLTEDHKALHYHLADLYERTNDPKAAIRHFRRVYTKDIKYRDVYDRLKQLEES